MDIVRKGIRIKQYRIAYYNSNGHNWVIDLDIKSFFDTIDHELLMKGVKHFCEEKWILLYVERWIKAGVIAK